MEELQTKKYAVVKTVEAVPMSREDAARALGGAYYISSMGEDGYLIEYEDGWRTWLSTEDFEKAYKCIETFVDRMRIELSEVKERFVKLEAFRYSEGCMELGKEAQHLLSVQAEMMRGYMTVLLKRIELSKETSEHDKK